MNRTRWSAREDARKSLRKSWQEVLITLESTDVVWNGFSERINRVIVQIQASTVDFIIALIKAICYRDR